MSKIILTRGLPASGKSTWCRELMSKEHGKYKRVNKDDLRAMLDNSKWSKANEAFVLKIRDYIVEESLKEGWNVIVDDTNFHPKHKLAMEAIVSKLGVLVSPDHKNKTDIVVEEKDFTDVPIEICIERDLKRPNSVGEKVIRNMYRQFMTPPASPPEKDPNKLNAVIFDIDGTLALFGSRDPYDRDFEGDEVNTEVAELLRSLTKLPDPPVIVLLSGRMEKSREATERWLKANDLSCSHLFMRQTDDMRKDSVVKKEIYEREIAPKYNVQFIVDDRIQVVEMFRSLGITVLQCDWGDF